ncbi:hypothetical protein [Pseudorhodobacter aquimaris]|uniref:hypothetical protein n=1 Tax=Pseudorhodobacter aquimaris TaxID=687412 RepID=UPI0012EDFFAF|nr:hypothetical protein [Pseudorhodobacter aquimaris]
MASVNDICAAVADLKLTYSIALRTRSVDTPFAALRGLGSLSRDFTAYLVRNPAPNLSEIATRLTTRFNQWNHSAGIQSLNEDAVRSTMYWNLSIIQRDLTFIGGALDCGSVVAARSSSRTARRGDNQQSLSEDLKRTFKKLVPSGGYLAIFATLIALLAIIFYPRKKKRGSTRRICNIPLHIYYGKQCTVTRIVDLSEGGMKIEATEKYMGQTWAEYNFAGFQREGKVAWRNTAYAGVKFRKCLTSEMIKTAMKYNNKPLGESGIEKTAPACFHVGCHKNCVDHLPPTLSSKQRNPVRGTS